MYTAAPIAFFSSSPCQTFRRFRCTEKKKKKIYATKKKMVFVRTWNTSDLPGQ